MARFSKKLQINGKIFERKNYRKMARFSKEKITDKPHGFRKKIQINGTIFEKIQINGMIFEKIDKRHDFRKKKITDKQHDFRKKKLSVSEKNSSSIKIGHE